MALEILHGWRFTRKAIKHLDSTCICIRRFHILSNHLRKLFFHSICHLSEPNQSRKWRISWPPAPVINQMHIGPSQSVPTQVFLNNKIALPIKQAYYSSPFSNFVKQQYASEKREMPCCSSPISITMHNLKHWAILGALCRLARVRPECEPSESEYKTNDGNGCNYIYGHVLIWLTKSLSFPSLSLPVPFYH